MEVFGLGFTAAYQFAGLWMSKKKKKVKENQTLNGFGKKKITKKICKERKARKGKKRLYGS